MLNIVYNINLLPWIIISSNRYRWRCCWNDLGVVVSLGVSFFSLFQHNRNTPIVKIAPGDEKGIYIYNYYIYIVAVVASVVF